MTDANGVTVSNGYADNNAPYDVATKTISGKRFQKVILYDGSGNEVTSWTITPSGTQDINLKQVGGVATSLGSKDLANGIPVSISYDQIRTLTDIDTTPVGGLVALFSDPTGYYQPAPLDEFGRGVKVAAYALDGSGLSIASATTTPGASDRGYVARLGGSTNAIGRVGHDITGIVSGRKVVTTAGTRVTLVSSSTPCKKIDIVAETDNTGVIVVGGSGCIAALSTREGVPLSAGQPYSLEIDDAQDVYLDSTVSGDGVTFVYYT